MDIQKERPIFNAWHYQDWKSNISANINESEYLEWYQRIYSHFATQQERELQFKTWLAAKAQAVPDGNNWEQMYRCAIINAKKRKNQLNWAHVASMGVGSGKAVDICEYFNIDPSATDMRQAMIEAVEGE